MLNAMYNFICGNITFDSSGSRENKRAKSAFGASEYLYDVRQITCDIHFDLSPKESSKKSFSATPSSCEEVGEGNFDAS